MAQRRHPPRHNSSHLYGPTDVPSADSTRKVLTNRKNVVEIVRGHDLRNTLQCARSESAGSGGFICVSAPTARRRIREFVRRSISASLRAGSFAHLRLSAQSSTRGNIKSCINIAILEFSQLFLDYLGVGLVFLCTEGWWCCCARNRDASGAGLLEVHRTLLRRGEHTSYGFKERIYIKNSFSRALPRGIERILSGVEQAATSLIAGYLSARTEPDIDRSVYSPSVKRINSKNKTCLMFPIGSEPPAYDYPSSSPYHNKNKIKSKQCPRT